MGLLSLSIWTPIFFGVVLLAFGRDDQAKTVRWIALDRCCGQLVGYFAFVRRFQAWHLCDAVC